MEHKCFTNTCYTVSFWEGQEERTGVYVQDRCNCSYIYVFTYHPWWVESTDMEGQHTELSTVCGRKNKIVSMLITTEDRKIRVTSWEGRAYEYSEKISHFQPLLLHDGLKFLGSYYEPDSLLSHLNVLFHLFLSTALGSRYSSYLCLREEAHRTNSGKLRSHCKCVTG